MDNSLNQDLHSAVEQNDIDEVRRLLKEGASYWAYDKGETALNVAARKGHPEIAEVLIK